jgi:protease I
MKLGLEGKRIAILATDGVDERELLESKAVLDQAGAVTEVVSPKAGEIQAMRAKEKGVQIRVDCELGTKATSEYAALLVPGGSTNTDALHANAKAVQFVREFMASDKPVAAICHGARLLIDADAVGGRTLTSSPSLKGDVEAAGGHWVDEPVHVDDRLLTGRSGSDIAAFKDCLVKEFGYRIVERRVDQNSEQSFPASDPPSF